MRKIVVVATDEEYELAKKRFKGHRIIKTGVGGVNVIETLKHVPKWHKIINFGYAGSNDIPIGTEVRVGFVIHKHKTTYDEPVYVIGELEDKETCLTSDEFVEEYNGVTSVVFDMELAYICALGFKNIKAIKIVSDNLNQKQYEESIKKEVLV